MKEWIKANGGPAALIVLGVTLTPWKTTKVGIFFILLGVGFWVYKAPRFPYKLLKKSDAAFTTKANKEVVDQTREVVKGLGALLAQHVRYKPPFHDEHENLVADSHAAWARSVNRSNSHDQLTAARFFEDHYMNLMVVVSSLHSRGALTQDEVRQINWWIGTSTLGGGIVHQLADIPPLLTKAADRLESGHLPDPESRYER